jgi:two-component sensor histidine kinase
MGQTREVIMLDFSQAAREEAVDGELLYQQTLKYADDLVKVYQAEQARRTALESANRELRQEVNARRCIEKELMEVHQQLEQRVLERTRDLSVTNRQLTEEVKQRKIAEALLRSALSEKEVLFAEVHHRVKNNLQIVSSLLGLQADRMADEHAAWALEDCRNRIKSMALIHEQLYRSKHVATIDFAEYIEGLGKSVMNSYGRQSEAIRLRIHMGEISLPLQIAVPCGLIVNELVTNAVKHAFAEGQAGEVIVEFRRTDEHRCRLTVEDTGKGMPDDFDLRSCETLGLQLVRNLAEFQLRGTVGVEGREGTRFVIEFPDPQTP